MCMKTDAVLSKLLYVWRLVSIAYMITLLFVVILSTHLRPLGLFLLKFVGCSTSQQHARMDQLRQLCVQPH